MNYLIELLHTFSNKPSFFSSKRFERFAVFASMLAATNLYLVIHILRCDLSAGDLMIVVVGWLGYAGFTTVQIKKDKHEDNESIPKGN